MLNKWVNITLDRALTMNITYRSDTDSDFKCLEESIARGEFGELNDLWKVELEREKGFFARKMQEIFSNY